MTAYYNEHDPYAAQWLRNLIAVGHIAPGDVDERDIRDVKPEELRKYTQCHFFAGVGVWSYALRRAGWPDDRPVWTGSCPCQPFSTAGRGAGVSDERHLWPHFFHLITQCRPGTVFGEQVASKYGLGWLDLVQADLEGTGYASAAVDLCAAGIGAPHIRQRLWFVAERVGVTNSTGSQQRWEGSETPRQRCPIESGGGIDRVADASSKQYDGARNRGQARGIEYSNSRAVSGVADARLPEPQGWNSTEKTFNRIREERDIEGNVFTSHGAHNSGQPGPTNGFWSSSDWLFCRDGKWRPVEPGTFPLAHGATQRVGRLRAYGNAINAEAAEAFIEAYMTL